MVEDIEQDWHIRGHLLLCHMSEDKDQEDGAEEEDEDEVTKMIMRGRKEKKMKEKMTNGTLMNTNLPF